VGGTAYKVIFEKKQMHTNLLMGKKEIYTNLRMGKIKIFQHEKGK
jgi:hypothetical protein